MPKRLSTSVKIRTLQRKLYTRAKREPGFRFYALYDKVCRADILDHAYTLVRANRGAPGIDGVTCASIEAGEGRSAWLTELAERLAHRTYRAGPVRRVQIPKADGGEPSLGIPTLRDRVVQMAAKLVLEPIFEADFEEHSHGFRPGRSAHDAIDDVAGALVTGHNHVIDADLSRYFDTIPHAKLLAVVAERVSDRGVLALIRRWLKAPVVEEDDNWRRRGAGGGEGNRRGTPQGGVIFPLLANLYLHLLDRIWSRQDMARTHGGRLVRYADDLVILCRGSTDAPMGVLRHVLGRLDLQLNESRTHVVDARMHVFDFLGFRIVQRRSRRSGKLYPHVEPSKLSIQRVRDRVRQLTDRRRTLIPVDDVVTEVNRTLRGWSEYFHYRNCSGVFSAVKMHAEQRIRTHLRRRHKLASRAQVYQRFPGRVIHDRFGLFRMPTTAGWRPAHARV